MTTMLPNGLKGIECIWHVESPENADLEEDSNASEAACSQDWAGECPLETSELVSDYRDPVGVSHCMFTDHAGCYACAENDCRHDEMLPRLIIFA